MQAKYFYRKMFFVTACATVTVVVFLESLCGEISSQQIQRRHLLLLLLLFVGHAEKWTFWSRFLEFQYSDPCLGRCHCGFETKKASYTCAKTAIRYCVLRIRIAYAESVWGRRVWAKMGKRIRKKGSPFFSSPFPPLLLPPFGHHSKSPIGVVT